MALLEALRELSPSGPGGFEALIAELLSTLTGLRFRLARSGSQSGRDSGTGPTDTTVIAVECKRYSNDKNIDERSLLGEIEQARQNLPELDLWVLAVSRQLPEQTRLSLERACEHNSLGFGLISWSADGLSDLAVLCAVNPVVSLGLLGTADTRGAVEEELASMRCHPLFEERVKQLREQFVGPLLGYAQFAHKQRRFLTRCMQTGDWARVQFQQDLPGFDAQADCVRRGRALDALSDWYFGWSDHEKLFVMLGEEGDGKTWSVVSWIIERVNGDATFPPVLFVPSHQASCSDPEALISNVIARQLGITAEQVARRLRRWMTRPERAEPILLLVLDGVNERQSTTWWRPLLESLSASPWM